MSLKEELRKTVGELISSPPKLGIVLSVDEDSKRFSEIQRKLKLSNSVLSYHLLKTQASGLVKKTKDQYSITPMGSKVARILRRILESTEEFEE